MNTKIAITIDDPAGLVKVVFQSNWPMNWVIYILIQALMYRGVTWAVLDSRVM